ncbi:hypothetical protein BD31_I1286 [Candidatus Nitrosopumilus salaria BD31]|uniref:Uncharacterized protein n=1 Tax=Candidatus Nitrosopumilus salarius BD31 TaxID=859350 RepID=I3D2V1_9ARCH|nr:hypothetical protein BD31_I1286 [Candidatus Nitrosopumilus salaria BD31]
MIQQTIIEINKQNKKIVDSKNRLSNTTLEKINKLFYWAP